MTENVQNSQNPARLVVLGIVALVVAGGIILALIQRNADDADSAAPTSTATSEPTATSDATADGEDNVSDGNATPDPTPVFGKFLEEDLNGQEAIDALGDRIDVVAERNGKTVEELTSLLQHDSTVYITTDGLIMFKDDFGKNDG
ncbi:hypothetical protein ACI3KS_08505 [Microbacterium sp. ZW T5_45]|uniref:hypothetical protein n=1 Tax=Microbacterium sp. ZW T5_45 TaxID=3378080 RepID=UPI00385363A7